MTSDPHLVVSNISKRFSGVQALERASLSVRRGSITSLIGPNGAGKSTLFDIITGFASPDSGHIEFAGQHITGLSAYRIARLGLIRTFQMTKVLTKLSVIDNLCLAAKSHPGERLSNLIWRPGSSRAAERCVIRKAEELLALFRLETVARHYAGTLSGGQRKLLEFARALMAEPEMIMLDEPMAGINPTLRRELLNYMQQLRASTGKTFFFVEHDMSAVMSVSDHILVMSNGRVIAEGSPMVVRQNQAVVDAYLGTRRTQGAALQ